MMVKIRDEAKARLAAEEAAKQAAAKEQSSEVTPTTEGVNNVQPIR